MFRTRHFKIEDDGYYPVNGTYYNDSSLYFLQLPVANADPDIPVMLWIHGGAFYVGSGNSDFYGPDYLVAENVVLVTINYRLGALGKIYYYYYY